MTRRRRPLAQHAIEDRFVGFSVCRAFGCRTEDGGVVGGNPAAVVLTAAPLSLAERVELATEVGLPMTAFVDRAGGDRAREISYFSRTGDEFQVCGHASVAAAWAVAACMGDYDPRFRLARPFPGFSIIETRVSISQARVALTLPVASISPCAHAIAPRVIADLAGIDVGAIEDLALSSVGDLLIVVAQSRSLYAMTLGEAAAGRWSREQGIRGLLFTCRSDRPTYDIETRAFFPAYGIGEDIACGSANCTVVAYWHDRLPGYRTAFRVAYPAANVAGGIGGEMDVVIRPASGVVELHGSVEM